MITVWDDFGFRKATDYLYHPLITFLQNRCLTYETSSGEAEPEARSCSTSAQNQQWKLRPDNTLRPRNDENKCLFLIEPEETRGAPFDGYGYKVLPCSSSYNNKKFTFEYLSHQISVRTSCTHFSNLKRKTIILSAPDGEGKTSVWFSGLRGDMWEPPLIVGFHNRFDVPVLPL